MFLLYHSEGYNICEMVLYECYVNDLHTTTCSGMLGHHTDSRDALGHGPHMLTPAMLPSPAADRLMLPSIELCSVATPSADQSPGTVTSLPPAAAPVHAMVMRQQDHMRKEKIYSDGTVRYDPRRRAFFAAPVSHREALHEPEWYAAMAAEFAALSQTRTWTLVP
jgi:hypothetical protein